MGSVWEEMGERERPGGSAGVLEEWIIYLPNSEVKLHVVA